MPHCRRSNRVSLRTGHSHGIASQRTINNFTSAQFIFQFLDFADIRERDGHTVDHILLCAVGHDAYAIPPTIVGANLLFLKNQRPQYFQRIVLQLWVVEIVDDTLLDGTNQQHKIRLAGIDSPEKAQDFGQRAKTTLSDLAFDQVATAECRKRDRYQREICVVKVAGKDVGLEQIRAGMAWWYRQYISEQTVLERADYEQAEAGANAGRLGLWSGKNPTPPWAWRRGVRLEE
jgi:endonuclease YncB( thermonuclease family)